MLDLYINCDVVVWIDSVFRLSVSNLPNAVVCLFLGVCVSVRACVCDVSEASVVVSRG